MPYRKKYQKLYRCSNDCGFRHKLVMVVFEHEWNAHQIAISGILVDFARDLARRIKNYQPPMFYQLFPNKSAMKTVDRRNHERD